MSSDTEQNTPLPENIVQGTMGELIAFLVLNAWPAYFGLPIMLGIVLVSKRVKRHATFINLIVALMIIGFSSTLLIFAGRITGPEPSRMLCLLQASLLYGMPALSSTAAFMLVLHMFLSIKAAYGGKDYAEQDHVLTLWLMIILPYVVFFASVLATAVVGAQDPFNVSRSRRFFYCSVSSLSLTNTLTTFSAIVLLGTMVLIVWTMVLLYRRWNLATAVNFDLNLPIRIIFFGMYIIISMSLSLLSIKSPSSPVPDLVIACASTIFILIFATQEDLLSVLCFWKRGPKRNSFQVDLSKEYVIEARGFAKANHPGYI